MDTISLPHPDQLRARIEACEAELRALRRLLRSSQDAADADAAKRRGEALRRGEEATHAR
jgi:hypothetical protein